MTISSALRPVSSSLRELVRRGGAMMPINGFALSDWCAVKPSKYDGKSSEESNANGCRPADSSSDRSGSFAGDRAGPGQVKVAFEHALPNVEGRE
jgi:hypothetical protein